VASPWKLYIYGAGDMRQSLEWLAGTLGISDRVFFAGFASVDDIWAANHVLVMPSRFEGLPLAMVEAMRSSRMASLASWPTVQRPPAYPRASIGSGHAAKPRKSARRARGVYVSWFPRTPSVYFPTSCTQSPSRP
jgi:glycosyltransferase involved in cell wall biosynthesis